MKIILTFVFALLASFVSAQSTTSVNNMSGYAAVYAEQPNMAFALLENIKASEATTATNNTPTTTTSEEPAAIKSMSEELSAWVENKQAVLSTVKKSKRLK